MMPKTNILTGIRLGMQGINGAAMQTLQNVLQNVVNPCCVPLTIIVRLLIGFNVF